MEKIKEVLKNILTKIAQAIKNIGQNQNKKMLEQQNYYDIRTEKSNIVDNNSLGEEIYIGPTDGIVFGIGGLELPIDSFEIEGNNININEEVTFTEDGRMLMRGKDICKNQQMREEIARQIKQNGTVTSFRTDSHGNVIKTDAEKYRDEMYDDEARKKTEEVSKEWRENSERTRENEKENSTKNNEENDKSDENAR